MLLDRPYRVAEGIVVGQGIATVGGQLPDVVSGGKNLYPLGRAQDHHLHRVGLHLLQGGTQIVNELLAEGIDLAVIEGDSSDGFVLAG